MNKIELIVQNSGKKSDIIKSIQSVEGYSILGVGNDRVVVENSGDKIYKIDLYGVQNKKEAEITESERFDSYICPVDRKQFDSKLISCPKAHTEGVDKTDAISLIDTIMEDTGFYPLDVRVEDIGMLNSRPVLIDYGFGMKEYNGHTTPSEILESK